MFNSPDGGVPWDDIRKILPGSADGHRIKWRRNIAENFNRLSRAHERYRQRDRQTTDGRTTTCSESKKREAVWEVHCWHHQQDHETFPSSSSSSAGVIRSRLHDYWTLAHQPVCPCLVGPSGLACCEWISWRKVPVAVVNRPSICEYGRQSAGRRHRR